MEGGVRTPTSEHPFAFPMFPTPIPNQDLLPYDSPVPSMGPLSGSHSCHQRWVPGELSFICLFIYLFEGNPVGEGTTRRGTATPVHRPQRPAGSTYSSTSDLLPREQLERQAKFHFSTEYEAPKSQLFA